MREPRDREVDEIMRGNCVGCVAAILAGLILGLIVASWIW
jgi:hypothetical protein